VQGVSCASPISAKAWMNRVARNSVVVLMRASRWRHWIQAHATEYAAPSPGLRLQARMHEGWGSRARVTLTPL